MTTISATFECCMCGDSGLSSELFRCKICQFRSQHRYCSNLYPKAQSYRVCNWCLIQKDDAGAPATDASNSTSPFKAGDYGRRSGAVTAGRKSTQPRSPIKKGDGASPAARKRVVRNGGGCGGGVAVAEERMIRRTRSEEMANGSVTPGTRHVFRNKVRRYKLLEEVSS